MTAKNDERCALQSDSAVFFEYKLWYNTRVKRFFEVHCVCGVTIHSHPTFIRIRRLFEAPVPRLAALRLLMGVG